MGERLRFFLAIILLVIGIVGLAIVGAADDGEEGEWIGYAIVGVAVLIALTLAHGIPGQREKHHDVIVGADLTWHHRHGAHA